MRLVAVSDEHLGGFRRDALTDSDRVLPSSERVVDSVEAGAEQIESNGLERIAVSWKEEA
jgi:hypothetical protein